MNCPLPPVVEMAVAARSRSDAARLDAALAELTAEDTTLLVSTDRESGQTVLASIGEAHLADKLALLKGAYGLELDVGAPQVCYRERLKKRVEIDYTHKKRTGGGEQFARVRIGLEPSKSGDVLGSKLAQGAMPEEFVTGVWKGVQSVLSSGILAGYPVVQLNATLLDGAFHEVASSSLAFEIAARAATREGLQKGGCELLEPIMTVEVTAPGVHASAVVADLRTRRAEGMSEDSSGDLIEVRAAVPLANVLGYGAALRALIPTALCIDRCPIASGD